MLIKANVNGIIIIANHLGMLGAISMGYSISIFKSFQLPQARTIRTKNVNNFAVYRPKWKFSSVINNGLWVRANNLFWRVAKIAPENPIHNVRCWTITCDAGTLRIPNSLVKINQEALL